jgi:uncharacterized membrane protein YphA (DoxX/SURF4 family)
MIHELKKYIRKELKRGYSLPLIKQELKNKGFPAEEINTAVYETTVPSVSILSMITVLLGLITLNASIFTVFIGMPFVLSTNLIWKYAVLVIIPVMLGLLNYFVAGEITIDDLEKNLLGILTPLPLVFAVSQYIMYTKTTGINPPLLFSGIWYFVASYWPFAYEDVKEHNHPINWIILGIIMLAITLVISYNVNLIQHVPWRYW